MSKKRVLSLFSGCGGMDLGFEGDFSIRDKSFNQFVNSDWKISKNKNGFIELPSTKFNTVFANDIKKSAQTVWTKNFMAKGLTDDVYTVQSIVDRVQEYKKGEKSLFPENIEIVTGGFPCQDFSVAGKRLGLKSNKSHTGDLVDTKSPNETNRGQLYYWMREVVAITQPNIFIAENVKGLVNLDNIKEIIENDFRNISENGYLVLSARILNAANYGVPQSRERVIFFGFKKSALKKEALEALSDEIIPSKYDPYPPITHYINEKEKREGLLPYVSVGDVLGDLLEPEYSQDPSQKMYSKAKYMGNHCQGQVEINWNGLGPTIRSEHHGNIEFRRLSMENKGKLIAELKSGLKERRLSVRECARIQTFPDDFQFVINPTNYEDGVSASEAYKLVGNAVPPLLGYHIAKRIENNWDLYFGG